MQLDAIQKAMGVALLEKEGLGVLSTPKAWTAFVQSEAGSVLDGVARDRLYLYEELLFASVEDTLGSFFPFTKRFMEKNWYQLVEEYRRAYPNRSYQLYRVAEDFPKFVAEQTELVKQFPFIVDLAWYEWLEIVALNAENDPLPPDLQPGFPDSPEGMRFWSPVANPTQCLRTYQYNIPELLERLKKTDKIKAGSFKVAEAPSEILIYRDMETFQARFFLLTPLTARFIQCLSLERTYFEVFQVLQEAEPKLQAMPIEQILAQGLGLIQQCFQANIILGSLPRENLPRENAG